MASTARPRRSSARIQNRHAQPQSPASTAQLSTLVERDTTPDHGVQPNLNSIVASAPAKTTTTAVAPKSRGSTTPSVGIKPSSEEMHPSQYHSIAKKRESSKQAGLESPRNHLLPSERSVANTEIPIASPSANPFSSPTFEFRFTRPSSDLSSEAQKLMDEVRGQAAKIKTQLSLHREEEEASNLKDDHGRWLANPKGKLGRYSDVHLRQFKKMTSIANHPSSFRADASKFPSPNKSLKRTNSKAALDKDDGRPARLPLVKAPSSSDSVSDAPSSPSKRAKISTTDSRLPRTGTTPSKAPLARSASAKSLKPKHSKIPSLILSPSTKSLVTPPALKPTRPNTDGKLLGAFSSKLTGVRSILRRPQLKFSDDPSKIAAGTHVSTPQKAADAMDVDDKLADGIQQTPGSPCHRKEKHVNFSSSPAQVIQASTARTPSPTKNLVKYPALPETETSAATPTRTAVHFQSNGGRVSVSGPVDFTFRAGNPISFSPGKATTPTIRQVRPSDSAARKKALDFPSVPHGLSNKKRKRESPSSEGVGEDKENVETGQNEGNVSASPAKKIKTTAGTPTVAKPKGVVQKTKTPVKGKAKGILSMSRLNALARPKNRG